MPRSRAGAQRDSATARSPSASPTRGRNRARNASHRERHVVGQPRLHAPDRRSSARAGRRGPVAVMCVSRIVASGCSRSDALDQRRRGARLAERNRVDPDDVAPAERGGAAVTAEPLADVLAIARARAGRATRAAAAAQAAPATTAACRGALAISIAAQRAAAAPGASTGLVDPRDAADAAEIPRVRAGERDAGARRDRSS